MDSPGEGETLVADPAAYDCLHPLALEWPCPSFDLLEPRGGPARAFPFAAALVVGTQARAANGGQMAVKERSNSGQTAVKEWSNSGQRVVKSGQSSSAPRQRPDSGQTAVIQWS